MNNSKLTELALELPFDIRSVYLAVRYLEDTKKINADVWLLTKVATVARALDMTMVEICQLITGVDTKEKQIFFTEK